MIGNNNTSIVLTSLILFLGYSKTIFSQGDSPCSAASMTVNSGICGTYTSGTTVGATYSNNAANGGTPTCATPGTPDVWYSFVAPLSGLITITTTAGTITDSGIQLYSSSDNTCTGTLTALTCDDNSGPGNMSQLNLCGLTGGNTYFLRLWRKSTGTGTFNICFYIPAIAAASTNCAGAATVCSDVAISGNSSGAGTAELNVCNRGCLSVEHQSSWYYYTTPTAGNLDLSIVPSAPTDDYDFAIWGPFTTTSIPCPPNGTPLRCSWAGVTGTTGVSSTNNAPQVDLTEGSGGNGWVQTIASNAGDTYILLIDNFVSSSQPFTLNWSLTAGATLGCTPLPIELLSFTAKRQNKKIHLKWSTASETNSDFFTVDKSQDGFTFEFVTTENGAGNSTSVKHYSTFDHSPYEGVSYYRLKQTDFDGSYTYSSLVEVEEEAVSSGFSFDIYPNPTDGDVINIVVAAEKGEEVLVVLYDAIGRVTYSKVIIAENDGDNLHAIDMEGHLPVGIYFVTATSENNILSKKLIIR